MLAYFTYCLEFEKGGIGYVEMLFRCNILALVGGGKNPRYPLNKVMIWDDHQNRCIGELSFRSAVRAVKLRRDRVVVVLEYKIYVYNFADLKLVDQIDTTSNVKGLCALCPDTEHNVLVCPALERGVVRVHLYDEKKETLIPAHTHPLSCFALNADGSRLATASDEGTLIRIFDTKTGLKLQELRRGADPAEIYSICFKPDGKWLAVSSDKSTVHVFSLEDNKDGRGPSNPDEQPATTTVAANPRSAFSFLSTFLPTYFGSQWSFSRFPLPQGIGRTIVAFGQDANSIIVVSADGTFFKALYDPTAPGQEATQDSHAQFMVSRSQGETTN
jgi:WD40 repeat protein